MLYKPAKKLTFVIYEDQKSTKCFEINKAQLKVLIILIPLITAISLACVFGGVTYFESISQSIKRTIPATILKLRKEKKILKEEKSKLAKFNDVLTTKLSSKKVGKLSLIPIIRPVLGAQDISEKNIISIDQVVLKNNGGDTIKVSFNIVNDGAEKGKVAGFAFIIMKSSSRVQVYPQDETDFNDAVTTFNLGERFTVTRFRPVEGRFAILPNIKKATFYVYIFSLSGDLIYKKIGKQRSLPI